MRKLDALFEGRLARSAPDADPIAVVQVGRELRARRLVLVATDGVEPGGPADRGGPGRARAPRRRHASPGRSTTRCRWPRRASCRPSSRAPSSAATTRAAGRARPGKPAVERFVVCGAGDELAARPRARPELIARWTNVARELVDAPPNVIDAGRPRRARRRAPGPARRGPRPRRRRPPGARRRRRVEHGAAAAHRPAPRARGRAPERPRIALVGKAVTFDAGGYFLKPQSDIVRQKGDMAGGAAVLAALGAIAELGLRCQRDRGPPRLREHDRPRRDPAVGRDRHRRGADRRGDEPGRRGPPDPRRRALVRARRGRDARRRPRDADRRDAGRDGRPLRRRLRQRRGLARRDRRRGQRRRRPRVALAAAPALPPPARVARSPTCATPRGAPTAIRSRPPRSSSASPATGRGRTSTCSAPRSSTTIAATRSAPGPAATACACSSSSPRAWPRRSRVNFQQDPDEGRSGAGRRTTTTRRLRSNVDRGAEDADQRRLRRG